MNRTPFRPYMVKHKALFLRFVVRQNSYRLFRPSRLALDEHTYSDPVGCLPMNMTLFPPFQPSRLAANEQDNIAARVRDHALVVFTFLQRGCTYVYTL